MFSTVAPRIAFLSCLLFGFGCVTPAGLKPIPVGVDGKRPQIDVRLERVKAGGKALNVTAPTNVEALPVERSDVLIITEKPGRLLAVDLGTGDKQVLVETEPMGSYPEMGLVGLAFHPDFQENRRLFTYRVAKNPETEDSPAKSLIEEWTLKGDTVGSMELTAVGTVFRLDQPQQGHQSGGMTFGPDGYLYIPFGDGGFQTDPNNFGQNTTNHHSSILRLDIDNREEGQGYSVPADNPFVGGGHLPEVWAYGFRNPWRSTWTKEGRYIVADVGQNAVEEIDIIVRGGNYGWSLKEGTSCHKPRREREGSCEDSTLIDPIYEYRHGEGAAIIGGPVYYGEAIPALQGLYVFGDNTNGKLWALTLPEEDDGQGSVSALGMTGLAITTFGRDPAGEVLVGTWAGRIYRIVAAP
jgi:glucose/arabinose dehydrogenase